MTKYYLYIKTGVRLDADTRFYKVGSGESESQLRILSWLEAYAVEHGHFFALWSHDAADFLLKCRDSIGHDVSPLVLIDGSALRSSLRSGFEDPAVLEAISNRNKLMRRIDSRFYTYYRIGRK